MCIGKIHNDNDNDKHLFDRQIQEQVHEYNKVYKNYIFLPVRIPY